MWVSRHSCFPTVSDGFRPNSNLFGEVTNFRLNAGSADIAAFLQFQTFSDLFQTSLDWPLISSCSPTVSDGFRPVSHLFGLAINFHINVGSADIAAFLQFQTFSDPFQTSLDWPQISSCFPSVSDGFRPVSNLFGLAINFHINVGSADIAAFLQFHAVTNLFLLLQYYKVLLCTIPYYKVLLQYYKVLLQYYSVLQSVSTTPVLLCTTKCYSVLQTTTPYKSTTPVYYKVLLQY